jgi:type I restriction enzyme M protein
MLSPQLKSKIRSLWDAFWAGGVANPLSAIEQITYLVFLKRLEDLDTERAKNARAAKQKYKSIFDFKASVIQKLLDGEQYRWSYIKRLPPEERFTHVRNHVFDWMKSIEGATPEDQERMRDAVFLIPNAGLLERAMNILDDLFVPERNQDTLGDIYEDLLNEIATAGKNGQFRTPRHIIRAMCDLVDVKFGELVCDPACGTGGFLVNAYQHILEANTSPDILRYKEDGTPINAIGDKLTAKEHKALRSNHLHGFDFDRTMVRLGWMNMIQHGLDNPQISYADALGSKFNAEVQEGGKWHEHFDVVLANPPFTGNIDKTDIGDTLRPLGTNKTELLFVDLILQLLKPGGRAAVIVPEGVLFGSSKAHLALRKKLIEKTQLQAVISLPGGVFQPYAGVKTSILVFVKGGKTENVWFYEVSADGEELNAKRTADPENNDLWDMRLKFKLRYSQEAPAFIRPYQDELKNWQLFGKDEQSLHYLKPQFTNADETDDEGNVLPVREVNGFVTQALEVSKDWIGTHNELNENDSNLSAGRYKPFILETTKHIDPATLIGELKNLEDKIQDGLDTLLAMVKGVDE